MRDATLEAMSLDAVFSPKSVAIIGASTQPGSVGNDIVKNLVATFKGKIYPVNLKGGELYSLPVFTTISQVPSSVDLVIICVPAAFVLTVLREACAKKKVKAAIIISAGFKEIGNTSQEEQLKVVAEKYHCTLVGPNCLGVLNPHQALNASFAPTMPKPGQIAFISQSGALGVAVLDYAASHDLGFSKFISMGNKAGLDEAAVLEFLQNDPETKVILLYVENIADFKKILAAAHAMRSKRHPKPILVLKSGATQQGAAAAQSHTGALAGSDALYDALFRQAGMVRVQSVEELFLLAECFLYNPLLKRDRVAVITNAGGIGVLVTDALVREELTLSALSSETQQELKAGLPAAASVHNPVDVLGDASAERYEFALSVVLKAPEVDAALVLLTPQSMTDVAAVAHCIRTAKKKSKKPIIVSFLGGSRVQQGLGILHAGSVATASFPELAAQAFGVLKQFSLWSNTLGRPKRFTVKNSDTVAKIFKQYRGKNTWLSTEDVFCILTAYGLPTLPSQVVRNATELLSTVRACGPKVVLKVLSKDILHKSDAGGVVLDVTVETAQTAYERLLRAVAEHNPRAQIDGVLVMQQLTQSGFEMILGSVRTPDVGALVGCGSGGIFTETLNDAAFSLVPADADDIESILNRLQVLPLLNGARGQAPKDIPALKDALARLSQLVDTYPEILEVDINPLVVFEKKRGAVILDARIRVR